MTSHIEENIELIKRILAHMSLDKSGKMKLPPERVLAESLSVQRAKVREALSVLEQFGFVQRVQGSGTFIEMPKPSFVQLYFEIAMQLNYINLETIEKARELLECAIAREAAQNATADEVKELWRLTNIMTESGDAEQSMDADFDFHLLLASMTRNPVVIILFQSLSTVLRNVLQQRRVMIHNFNESFAIINSNHIAIVQAIEERDGERASTAMAEHFTIWDQQYQLSALLLRQSQSKS